MTPREVMLLATNCVRSYEVVLIIKFHVLFLGKPPGYDRVRNAEIGNKDFELDVMEEAYTTEHWIVRIYKVKDMPNRGVR